MSSRQLEKAVIAHWAAVARTFNPTTREGEAGGSLWVLGQPGLQELVPGQVPKLQRNPVSKNKTKQKQKETNKQTKKVAGIGGMIAPQARITIIPRYPWKLAPGPHCVYQNPESWVPHMK